MAIRPTPFDYAGEFTSKYSQFSAGATGALLVGANGSRVLLAICVQNGVNDVGVLPGRNLTTTEGLILPALGGWETIRFQDWGTVVCEEWYCRSGAGAALVGVVEVMFTPRNRS